MNRPDGLLVAGYLAGDDRCFAALIERYQVPLLRMLREITGDAGLAEDAAQEALLAAACTLETLDQPDRFRSWLFRIAYRKGTLMAKKRLRRRENASIHHKPELASDESSSSTDRHEHPVRDRLRRVLRTLPRPDRVLLDMRFLDGIPYTDIAEITGSTTAAVRTRIWRLKQILLERLGGGLS